MIELFYISGTLAVLFTVCVVFNRNPIHALLFLICSFLSIACNFFSLGMFFPAVIHIIVYTGAVMVLFIFVVMMININISFSNRRIDFVNSALFFGVMLSVFILFMILCHVIYDTQFCFINIYKEPVTLKQIGIKLFGRSYMLIIEMASLLLLSALISALHIAQKYECDNFSDHLSDNNTNDDKKIRI